MAKVDIGVDEFASAALPALRGTGLLLVSASDRLGPNVMTIGWGLVGNLWGLPVFVVFVRPSRYTHRILEEAGDFTVNVPARGMEDAVSKCGTVSGRRTDKFKETGLEPAPSRRVRSPIVRQCIAHLECSVVYRSSIDESRVPEAVKPSAYPKGDYHDVYFGEVLEAYADEDYRERLP
jgi:flavin reductase (DIM6/NTAB) family NADH-FMN oxidoreductase RutF